MLLADRIQIQQVVTNLILNPTEVMESVEAEMRKLIIELSTAPSTLRLRSLRQTQDKQCRLCSIRFTKLAHGKQGRQGLVGYVIEADLGVSFQKLDA
jgi:phosphoglycerate-specific signal transduction histidine kinase